MAPRLWLSAGTAVAAVGCALKAASARGVRPGPRARARRTAATAGTMHQVSHCLWMPTCDYGCRSEVIVHTLKQWLLCLLVPLSLPCPTACTRQARTCVPRARTGATTPATMCWASSWLRCRALRVPSAAAAASWTPPPITGTHYARGRQHWYAVYPVVRLPFGVHWLLLH